MNGFLERLDRALDWRPLEQVLQAMYLATTCRPPCAPLALFKMSLLQPCCGLSDPQCEELVSDRLSWRCFLGLGLQDAVPAKTTLVRFRQRLCKPSRGEKLRPATMWVNRLFSLILWEIEKVFGWWKRSAGYRRVCYVGRATNWLEFKSICWNLKRLANLTMA